MFSTDLSSLTLHLIDLSSGRTAIAIMDFLDFAPQTPRYHRQAKACEKSRSSNDDFIQRAFG